VSIVTVVFIILCYSSLNTIEYTKGVKMKKIFSYIMALIHHEHNFFLLNKAKKSLLIGLCVFICVLIITKFGYYSKVTLLIPPIAASCVIIFTLPQSPFSHPKNILLGHVISGSIGIIIVNLMSVTSLSLSIALSLAVFSMLVTDTLHPPAGATTILIMLTNAKWYFIFFPLGIGAIILCIISIFYRKLHKFVKKQNPSNFSI